MQRPKERSTQSRRTYNRNSNNNFKFHNFVFNKDNQSFCLEEQDGNKRISVHHWKKNNRKQDNDSRPKLIEPTVSQASEDNVRPSSLARAVSSGIFMTPSDLSLAETSNNDDPLECSLITNTSFSSSVANSSSHALSNFSSFDRLNLEDDYKHSSSLDMLTSLASTSHENKDQSTDIDSDYNEQIDEDEEMNSDHSSRSNDEDEDEYKYYNDYLKWKHLAECDSGPLDLTVKSMTDHNNNNIAQPGNSFQPSFTLSRSTARHNLDVDSRTSSERALPDIESNALAATLEPSCHLSKSESNLLLCPKSRTEATSPSVLISSLKCCSPPGTGTSQATSQSDRIVNPFSLARRIGEAGPSAVASAHSCLLSSSLSCSSSPTLRSLPNRQERTSYIFDTFLEDEIFKGLQTNVDSMSRQSPSTLFSDSGHAPSLNDRIEDKLHSLRQEILQSKHKFDESFQIKSSFNTESPLSSDQDHVKMHFKMNNKSKAFDAGESIFARSGRKTNFGKSRFDSLVIPSLSTSSPLANNSGHELLSSSSSTLPSRMRSNQRNQIKRQLEDVFKQSGVLVKTKQVSDANNSAMFCKFRQLRKCTRHYMKSLQTQFPDEVNKLWKQGLMPPKADANDLLDARASCSTLRAAVDDNVDLVASATSSSPLLNIDSLSFFKQ